MVHIPDENDPAPTPRPSGKQPLPSKPPAQAQRPATGESRKPPTGEAKRPPTGEQPVQAKTGPVQRPPGGKAPTKPAGPPTAGRATQMLSLEPPKRNKGPSLAKDVRIDALGGPKTISQRNKNLMGNIGREKTQIMQRQPNAPQPPNSGEIARPTLKKPGDSGRAVDLGAHSRQDMEAMMRRKATRRIPKPGGGFMSDDAPLASMESGRMAPVAPGQPQAPQRPPEDPASRINVPPRVDIPIPQAPSSVRKSDVAPPPLSARGNTLAGVSAEDLLGDEGRRVLEDMRRREAEARARGDYRDTRRVRQGGQYVQPAAPAIQPPAQDSQRRGFAGADYQPPAQIEPPAEDTLQPQNFLSGPTKVMQREVVQTPQPVYEEVVDTTQPPPPDDLGYEKPVDFGDQQQAAPAPQSGGSAEEPVARESQAQDEMEQRAGYLLWLQGVITREEVEEALTAPGSENVSGEVRDLLLNTGFTEQITLYRFLARHESVAPVDFSIVAPTNRALATLRPAIAKAYRVIPFAKIGELLLVAAAFPFDPKRLLELRRLTASKVKLYVATEEEIDAALEEYYGGTGKPVTTEDDSDDSVTGEGDTLEQKYDPTLSGEDSGLYAPQQEGGPPPGDVGLAELDYDGGGVGSDSGRVDRPVRSNVRDTLDDAAIAAQGDLDESTLGAGGAADSGDDELDLNAPSSGDSAPSEDSGSSADESDESGEESGIETGPEEHDPFKE